MTTMREARQQQRDDPLSGVDLTYRREDGGLDPTEQAIEEAQAYSIMMSAVNEWRDSWGAPPFTAYTPPEDIAQAYARMIHIRFERTRMRDLRRAADKAVANYSKGLLSTDELRDLLNTQAAEYDKRFPNPAARRGRGYSRRAS